jgi:hypothetical protein
MSWIMTRSQSVTIVNAIRDLGAVGKGGSGSHFFQCDDGKEYVVKFAALAPDKTVINELIGGSLAMILKLPTPKMVLVMLSVEIITLSEDLRRKNIQPGIHLGIERLPKDCWDFDTLPANFLSKNELINREDLYGVVTFDNWLLNTDRNNPGNNMLELLPKNKMRYVMIDFGHCLTGNVWDQTLQIQMANANLMPFYTYFLGHINQLEDFEAWFVLLEGVSDRDIDTVVSNVPPAWSLSNTEKQVVIDFIKHRRYLPRSVIIASKSVFGI